MLNNSKLKPLRDKEILDFLTKLNIATRKQEVRTEDFSTGDEKRYFALL